MMKKKMLNGRTEMISVAPGWIQSQFVCHLLCGAELMMQKLPCISKNDFDTNKYYFCGDQFLQFVFHFYSFCGLTGLINNHRWFSIKLVRKRLVLSIDFFGPVFLTEIMESIIKFPAGVCVYHHLSHNFKSCHTDTKLLEWQKHQ